jgi:ABC-2 type transport system permease protein/sodium transport system permease protein
LVYRDNSPLSKKAVEYVSRRFRAVNEQDLRRRYGDLELPAAFSTRTVGGSGAGYSLTTLIPLVLVLMTITGAVYPAIDLTAGERERGTLEALMAAPVPRLGLLAAKYVAVMAVALLTAGANLLAMTITLLTSGLGRLLFGDAGLSPLVMIQILLLLVLFAGFFSAVLLAVTSFARSFKEAQAYLIPLMLLSLAPALLSLTPGVKFNALLAMTPLVNIVLLARDLFEGGVDPILALGAILSTALYALAAIGVAARIFGTDAILYGSEATWSDLLRRPAKGRAEPSLSGALLCLAILFPCSFLVTGLTRRLSYDAIGTMLVLNGVATVVLYGGLPLLVAAVKGMPLVEMFQLRRSSWLSFLGAVLLGLSLWPMAHEIFLLNRLVGLAQFSTELFASAREMQQAWRQVSPLLILASLALAPAVCEEFLFRGYLMRALLAAASPKKAIVVSALLFGVFHVLTTSVLGTERLLPSTFLGLILGWVCWCSRSILPGILLHACHNGLLLMILYYQEQLVARGWGIEERDHMPVSWLCASSVVAVIGLALVWFSTRAKTEDSARIPVADR